MLRIIAWLALGLLVGGCGDDDGPEEPAMVVGPYQGNVQLGEDTRTRLPDPVDRVGPRAKPRFYWFHPGAEGRTLRFEVRAETTALEHGSLIHAESVDVPPEGVPQGMLRLDPGELSRGGARRGAAGRLEWLPGVYSVKAFLGDAQDSFATAIFEVR